MSVMSQQKAVSDVLTEAGLPTFDFCSTVERLYAGEAEDLRLHHMRARLYMASGSVSSHSEKITAILQGMNRLKKVDFDFDTVLYVDPRQANSAFVKQRVLADLQVYRLCDLDSCMKAVLFLQKWSKNIKLEHMEQDKFTWLVDSLCATSSVVRIADNIGSQLVAMREGWGYPQKWLKGWLNGWFDSSVEDHHYKDMVSLARDLNHPDITWLQDTKEAVTCLENFRRMMNPAT